MRGGRVLVGGGDGCGWGCIEGWFKVIVFKIKESLGIGKEGVI